MEGWREEGKVAGGSRIKLREKERARKIGRERVDRKGERSRAREIDR